MKVYLQALIDSFVAHLGSGRCEDPEAAKAEVRRLRELQAAWLATIEPQQ